MKIDISADLGESFGRWKLGYDEEMMEYISSANLPAGFTPAIPWSCVTRLKLCKKHGVKVGTHVGFPDLMGFGRRMMALTPEEYLNYSLYQGGALQAIARAEGEELQHFTWHGSAGMTFHADHEEERPGRDYRRRPAGQEPDCPPDLRSQGRPHGPGGGQSRLRAVRKFFADRAMEASGALVGRKKAGSVITDAEECRRPHPAHGPGA